MDIIVPITREGRIDPRLKVFNSVGGLKLPELPCRDLLHPLRLVLEESHLLPFWGILISYLPDMYLGGLCSNLDTNLIND